MSGHPANKSERAPSRGFKPTVRDRRLKVHTWATSPRPCADSGDRSQTRHRGYAAWPGSQFFIETTEIAPAARRDWGGVAVRVAKQLRSDFKFCQLRGEICWSPAKIAVSRKKKRLRSGFFFCGHFVGFFWAPCIIPTGGSSKELCENGHF